MPDKIQQIREEAIRILREDYPKVKDGMVRLETFLQFKSRKAVYELRDFVNHLASLFQENISEEEAEKHINECKTHLRRCAVEPLEYMAEKRFVKVASYARWFAMVPFIPNNPTTKPEFFEKMQEVKGLIAEGRNIKTEGKACEKMDKAFGIVTDLYVQVHPVSYLIQGILWLIMAFIMGWIAAMLALPKIIPNIPNHP